ncbi:MAG: transaldolase family protein [Anaerolineaceae bacterium]|nr:transaldolase family protein [Anaerolineaceae bacterium]
MSGQKELCPLEQSVKDFPTDYWNDSCSIKELTYAIERGAVGATSNPTIVLNVLKQEFDLWKDRIREIIKDNPTWGEVEITWQVIDEMGVKGAALLEPVFKRENGKKGRLSIQTNPANYRNAEAIVKQAIHFNTLAPNVQVKIPATKAGITAIEEATYRGININATVCFTVPQSLAVAEAVERGLERRKAEGLPVENMSPVCTIMVGRMDDWLKVIANRDDIIVDPDDLNWAGVACIKHAYEIYQERGYRTRLLAAAYRNHYHWSELVGGDVILTIPYNWQVRFNKSDIEVKDRFSTPVDPKIVNNLLDHFTDFHKAYDADGMTIDEFDTYGATVRTLRGFIASYHDLIAMIRDFMLPNPDVK